MRTFDSKKHNLKDIMREVDTALDSVSFAYSACRQEKKYAEVTPKLKEAKRILGEAWEMISKLVEKGPNPDSMKE